MKYLNAGQARVIMDGLGKDIWDELSKCGHNIGGGVSQELDGEIIIKAYFETGTLTKENVPESFKGFRIVCEERPMAVAF